MQFSIFSSSSYNGFSGKKSFGEHFKTFAIKFKWTILYLAFLEGASICEINPMFLPIDNDKSSWVIFLVSLISFTLEITYLSISSSDSCMSQNDTKNKQYVMYYSTYFKYIYIFVFRLH